MSQDQIKRAAAQAAIQHVPEGCVIGVGTGSTANYFVDELANIKDKIDGAVASSEATAQRLRGYGIEVVDLNSVDEIPVHLHMVKGGGGALTREKIVAAVAKKFVCIADESKFVRILGKFPLPVEIIPMAGGYVAREIIRLGGQPVLRNGFITDNGNAILDVHGLQILNPVELETELNQITGVVTNGLFARRGADMLLLGTHSGVRTFER